jgi:PKD repeat protein
MRSYILITIIAIAMLSSLVAIVSACEPIDPIDDEVKLDCSKWSQDDTTVHLKVTNWPLLNGKGLVSGHRLIQSPDCISSCCCDYSAYLDNCNCCYVEEAELTHRGTRGLGIAGQEDDEVDSINKLEFIKVSFDEVQSLRYFEIRSLFIEPFNDLLVIEQGDIILFLNEEFVCHYQFKGEQEIGNGKGVVIVPPISAEKQDINFDQVVFLVNPLENYSEYSEYSVAKIVTEENIVSFVQPLDGVDCDEINIPPEANFDYEPKKPSVEDKIQFIDISEDKDGEIVEWWWEFDDINETSTDQNPSYRFEEPGLKRVTLTVWDDKGDSDFIYKEFEVFMPPENQMPVAIAGGPYTGCASEEIILNGSSSFDLDGEIIEWKWSYTNGNSFPENIGEGEFANYTWEQPGRYCISLKVVDNKGAEDVNTTYIDIIDCSVENDSDGDGIPDEEDNCPEVPNPEQEDLDQDGVGNACDLDDDGDGYPDADEELCGSDPLDNESLPFDNDQDGIADCIDTDDDNDNVPDEIEDHNNDGNNTNDDNDGDGIPDYQDPDDDNDGIPTNEEDANENQDPTDDDSDSDGIPDYLDPEDDTQTSDSDEGDSGGNSGDSDNSNGGSSGGSNSGGSKYVGGGSEAGSSNKLPHADAGGPYSGYVGLEIKFTAINSNDIDGEIVYFMWNFGDGTTGIGEIVNHSYPEVGVYNVTLTVRDNQGKTDTNKTKVEILEKLNLVPIEPKINGTSHGKKNEEIEFEFVLIDEDGDDVRVIIHWGDDTRYISEFVSSGTTLVVSHTWNMTGEFTINAISDDGKDFSEISMHEIEILNKESKSSSNAIYLFLLGLFILILVMIFLGVIYKRRLSESQE